MAVLSKLEQAEGFTSSEKQLAQFILAHKDEVARMSITCLAERAFSSNASVIRLCRKLGADGYRDFRVELAADIERLRGARSDVDVNRPFSKSENVAAVMDGLAVVLKEAIDAARGSVDAHDIDRAARMIRRARHVYIFGSGDSRISGLAFANMLHKLGVHCMFAEEFGDTLANVSAVEAGDVGLFVSYSGKVIHTPIMQNVVRLFSERQCRMVWLSSIPKPFCMDVELRFPAKELEHGKVSTFYSQMCIRYLLNCLYGAVYALDYEGSSSHVDQIDELGVLLGAIEMSA